MSSIESGLLAFVCLLGGALLGMRLRKALPEHHLSDDSRHLLGLGLGVIGTMAGLVLGLLVGSATTSYNAQRAELLDVTSRVVLLDRVLSHYGPTTDSARSALRASVEQTLDRIWPQDRARGPQIAPAAEREVVLDDIEELKPESDLQRSLKSEAVGLALGLAQTRWLMFEQNGSSVSVLLLCLLIFWFTITFIGFGLFAPSNGTVVVALILCALAVSGAVFVTLEMYRPFEGLVQLSSAPVRDALTRLGQ